jgi:hypothetical protein
MTLFEKFVRALQRASQVATSRFSHAPPPFEDLVDLYEPTTQPLHTDAAFTAGEEFAFLLGEQISTPSSWITFAQWFPESDVMRLWVINQDYGPYDFPNVTIDDARVFAKADSKGAWYWGVWRGRTRRGPYPGGTVARLFGQVGTPTPLYRTVVRRRRR